MLTNINQKNVAVGIYCAAGLSALGVTTDEIRQILTQNGQTLIKSNDYITEKSIWVGAYQHTCRVM